MTEKIRLMMLKLCENQDWCWKEHIESVVKYSKQLAKKLKADEEVCELAAWLHDIIKIRDRQRELHHVKGSEEAEKILKKLGYPQDKIEKVKHCILTHSSDKNYSPESIEAKIVSSADAMAHFDNFWALAHTAYRLKRLSIPEGRNWVKKKYESCWAKMMPEAKEIARQKYDAVKVLLEEK